VWEWDLAKGFYKVVVAKRVGQFQLLRYSTPFFRDGSSLFEVSSLCNSNSTLRPQPIGKKQPQGCRRERYASFMMFASQKELRPPSIFAR